MNIITCYKIVPEDQDIISNDDRTLSFDRADWGIGQYDLNAIEAGIQLVDTVGGSVVALSAGCEHLENSKLRKAVLSRGPEELYTVVDSRLARADAHATAHVLAGAIKKIGKYDLVLCGEGSADLYAQQVGIQLGTLLGVPTINAACSITPTGAAVVVERALESETEVLKLSLPAVISVTTDSNEPRIPGMKDILAAGKKPITQWNLDDLGMGNVQRASTIVSDLAPEQLDRKQVVVEGDSDKAVDTFYDLMMKELA